MARVVGVPVETRAELTSTRRTHLIVGEGADSQLLRINITFCVTPNPVWVYR